MGTEFKYEIKVLFEKEITNLMLAKNSTISKLIRIIEIYYEQLQDCEYDIIWENDKYINKFDKNILLSDVFNNNKISNHANENSNRQIELIVRTNKEFGKFLLFECSLDGIKQTIKIEKNLIFQNLKINILARFPELELENFSILYLGKDITNYYDQNKSLECIFTNYNSHKSNEGIIKLNIKLEKKNIVELHRKCAVCKILKSTKICKKCAVSYCDKCYTFDSHVSIPSDFIKVSDFKNYEKEVLSYCQEMAKEIEISNLKLSSNNFTKMANEKISAVEKFFQELIDLVESLKSIQINKLKNYIESIKNRFQPESIEKKIKYYIQNISSYLNDPYIDIEESAKKINEFEVELKTFKSEFSDYQVSFQDLSEKYISSMNIDNNIYEYIKRNLIEIKYLYNKVENKKESFSPLLKVYDNKSILIYDHNIEEFFYMNFIDIEGKFAENFSNYVQCNLIRHNKLFIVTGNPCQYLYCYDYSTNEMEYISTMKYNHNWWPVLLIIENKEDLSQQTDIFCLSGSYTKKCEQMQIKSETRNRNHNPNSIRNSNNIKMEWVDLPDTNCEHGQASAFSVNNSIIYILFGYDYNINSISYVERLDLKGNLDTLHWEVIRFKNPDRISSILYYHSNLKFEDNCVYIIGGLKEIDQGDHVYKFNMFGSAEDEAGPVMYKTEHNFQLSQIKFCYEKNFLKLNIDEEPILYFGDDRINIDFDKTMKLTNEILDIKENSHYENNENITLSNLTQQTTYAIFDSDNNIHIINPKSFEYNLKKFNKSL